MATPRGTAAYKKKDGIITITDDKKTVIWTPQTAPGGPPAVSLEITNVTNLQQTPDTAAKVMLKIFEKPAEGGEAVPFLFHFNSTGDPRGEANAIKDLLSRLIAESKNNDAVTTRPAAAAGGGSGAVGSGSSSMAFANTANSKPAASRLFDDNSLKYDIELQQLLMKADRNLHQMYMEARATKPESMSDITFNAQFWSARINLLRAHAIESRQKKGTYNVLAEVRPQMETNPDDPAAPSKLKLNMKVEQIHLIFNQHPLVKRIYNENVPPLSEAEFWERFFLSKLSAKLRGERATGQEQPDRVFDKYDEHEDMASYSSRFINQHVSRIIDLEGNEENQGGFRSGNRADVEMRPRGRKDVPLIPTLNSLSEKMMDDLNSVETGLIKPTNLGEDVYDELALRDLRGDDEERRIMLNIKQQNLFFSSQIEFGSAASEIYAKQNPVKVLRDLNEDLEKLYGRGADSVDLHGALGIDDDSDSEDGGDKSAHVGSRASRKEAQKQILDSMLQRRAQVYGHAEDELTPMGLPVDIAARCKLTHATTMEFLHQFWGAFLSGDPDRAAEIGYLVESLQRSKARINAVAADADRAREEAIEKKKQEIRDIYKRTSKKTKMPIIRGGKDAVVKLMDPVVQSLDKAIADYQRALAAEGLQASTEG
ncbi:TFIIH p62 subunit domain-containing protein [Pseudomassariella vexata]|uniref:TFIIH p62 subunit domain-containing protein n=1 Tax=Pseudomassariella vexata TaxID=1141098 RepID=A0A1Y2DY76_9PEZI|nr:TFIIH p62 subunit domain-containing protein [Pseudomassariella vexata]ORY64252.1 TFIIH p62 subunit domain-containing protein [Pseudomassariella vexata]